MKPEVRHLPPAKTWRERIVRNRFGIARHLVQVLVLLAFVGTARWGWTIAGEKLLSGDLSSSLVLGTIPLSDPLALLERLFAGHLPQGAALTGAAIVFVLYAVLGSRTFCGWVCPMNLVTDLADALRRALKLDADLVHQSQTYLVLAGSGNGDHCPGFLPCLLFGKSLFCHYPFYLILIEVFLSIPGPKG